MKTLFGGILLAIGILIAGVSGLCTAYVVVASLGDTNEAASMLPLAAMIGGIPFVIGVGLCFAGRALINSARRDREPWRRD